MFRSSLRRFNAQKGVFDLQSLKEVFSLRKKEGENRTFKIGLTGDALLNNPRFNKGMGFTLQEREDFDLVGRLPSHVSSLDEQCDRAWDQVSISQAADCVQA